jgi:hypothetical protein
MIGEENKVTTIKFLAIVFPNYRSWLPYCSPTAARQSIDAASVIDQLKVHWDILNTFR